MGGIPPLGAHPPLRAPPLVVAGWSGRSGGEVGGVRGRPWGAQRCPGYRWASAIDGIYMIKKVVARASGTDLASSLKQNKFWMHGCVSVGAPRGGSGVRAGRGDTGGPLWVQETSVA